MDELVIGNLSSTKSNQVNSTGKLYKGLASTNRVEKRESIPMAESLDCDTKHSKYRASTCDNISRNLQLENTENSIRQFSRGKP